MNKQAAQQSTQKIAQQQIRRKNLARKLDLLRTHILAQPFLADDLAAAIPYPYSAQARFVVFLSVCDGVHRAIVRHGAGPTLDEAWAAAAMAITAVIVREPYEPLWLKADLVDAMDKQPLQQVYTQLRRGQKYFFRQGLAFDDAFATAYIEAELNGNRMIDYAQGTLSLERLRQYSIANHQRPLAELPQWVIVFKTRGYFCGEDEHIDELYTDPLNFGRRQIAAIDRGLLQQIITTSSQFLAHQVLENGQFVYGYYPIFDKRMTGYNILRHAGTIWSLLNQYKTTQDDALLDKIQRTSQYLLDNAVWHKDDELAYVVEHKANEIKLGGNAVALIMLLDTADYLGDSPQCRELAPKLGNGILTLLDQETGQYQHVLNYPDCTLKERCRTIYYDGEATFALAKLYGYCRDERYLQAACRAVEHFIAADYTQYVDHWVAYALDEITKYVLDQRFITFALQNAMTNLKRIYEQKMCIRDRPPAAPRPWTPPCRWWPAPAASTSLFWALSAGRR